MSVAVTSQSVSLPEPLPLTLHLGCGRAKYPGALGVDRTASPVTDVVWDLDRVPWPLPDLAFAKIYLVNVLEHLRDIVSTMEEVHRVARAGAEVVILAPFASSHHLWTDPTHRRAFTSRSFQYFTDDFADRNFQYSRARFRLLEATYEHYEDWMWRYRPRWYDRWLLAWANRHKDLYERRFMYWYQVRNIYLRMEAVK
jgi:SAM-dependent methyltransferase